NRWRVAKARRLITTSPRWYTLSFGPTISFHAFTIASSMSSGVSHGRSFVPSSRRNWQTPLCPKWVSDPRQRFGILVWDIVVHIGQTVCPHSSRVSAAGSVYTKDEVFKFLGYFQHVLNRRRGLGTSSQ